MYNFHSNHFKVYNSAAFSILTRLYTYHHSLTPEFFHHPQKKTCTHSAFSPNSRIRALCSWRPLICFLSPWICPSWAIFVLLHLASLTQCNVFKGHPCHSRCPFFTLFYGQIIFHCMDITYFVLFPPQLTEVWIASTFWLLRRALL